MGATFTGNSSRTRAGLITLIALRQARAIRERRAREAAKRATPDIDVPAKAKKKRGWFG